MLQTLGPSACLLYAAAGEPGLGRHQRGKNGNLQIRRREPEARRAPSATRSSRSAWRTATTSAAGGKREKTRQGRRRSRSSDRAPVRRGAAADVCGPLQRRDLEPAQLPRRSTSIAMRLPIRSPLSNRIRSSTPVTGSPSARTMVSRLISPASAAGPFGSRRRDHRAGRIFDFGDARVTSRHRGRLCGHADVASAARGRAGSVR